jgi:UPF0716 protein FxsA
MRISHILLFIFITVPLLEIYLLISVGQIIGGWNTVALVVLTAVIGTVVLRYQGGQVLVRLRRQMEEGTLPAFVLLEGVVLIIAGALLLTPGFFTDAVGFAFLFPPIRAALGRYIATSLHLRLQRHAHSSHAPPSGTVVEGEFRRDD